jgi:hypothetical protein
MHALIGEWTIPWNEMNGYTWNLTQALTVTLIDSVSPDDGIYFAKYEKTLGRKLVFRKVKGQCFMGYQGDGGSLHRNQPRADSQEGEWSPIGMATLEAPHFYLDLRMELPESRQI